MIAGVLIGFIAAVVLKLVFIFSRNKWPENYFDSSRRASPWLYDAPLKVLVWRTVPYILCTALVIAVASDAGAHLAVAVGSFYFFHLLSTNVYSLFLAIVDGKNRGSQVVYLLTMSLFLGLVAYMMILNQHVIVEVTPKGQGVIDGIWTAIFTAIVFAAYQAMTSVSGHRAHVNPTFASLGIDEYYVGVLAKAVYENNSDIALALAVVQVENANRPRAVRFLEFLLWRCSLKADWPRSVGIAQQPPPSEKSRSRMVSVDEHSLQVLAKKLENTAPRNYQERLGSLEVQKHANRVNPAQSYLQNVAKVHEGLYSGFSAVMFPTALELESDLDAEAKDIESIESGHEAVSLPAPWAVRSGDHLYLFLKIPFTAFRSVQICHLKDSVSRVPLRSLLIDTTNEEMARGVYRISSEGAGLLIAVEDIHGHIWTFPPLWFRTSTGIATLGEL